jgi:hypothetical protein
MYPYNTTFTVMLALCTLSATAHSATLEIEGTCPGEVTFSAFGFEEGDHVALLSADTTGEATVPVGRCRGESLGLSESGLIRRSHGLADAEGTFERTATVGGAACDTFVQAIAIEGCLTTDAVPVPVPIVEPAEPATFTPCGAIGRSGPDQAACDAAYAGTEAEGMVTVTAGVQQITLPEAGSYRITATGAQGAAADIDVVGGRGAEVCGVFEGAAGQVLDIAVGQMGLGQGSVSNGGGGGGSFVVDNATGALLIAAGGGGGTREDVTHDGCDANTGEEGIQGSGSDATWDCRLSGVAAGQGGLVSAGSWGSAGAGFAADGATDGWDGTGGFGWASGMLGGVGGTCGFAAEGGFGGGGSGNGCHGGGGGGGYTGGDGGRIAGGGGSFNTGAMASTAAGVGEGDGWVLVESDDGSGCP